MSGEVLRDEDEAYPMLCCAVLDFALKVKEPILSLFRYNGMVI